MENEKQPPDTIDLECVCGASTLPLKRNEAVTWGKLQGLQESIWYEALCSECGRYVCISYIALKQP